MKTIFYLSVISLTISSVSAQITGQLNYNELYVPFAEIYIEGSPDNKVKFDFDGYFNLMIDQSDEPFNLVLNLGSLILEIHNIDIQKPKLSLGLIKLPSFKSIEIYEFEKLNQSDKDACYPIYCWTETIGYFFTNELEDDYLTLNCKNKIRDYHYDANSKIITVDWQVMQSCN